MPIGLVNKYNAPKTILSEEWQEKRLRVTLCEGGRFAAACKREPRAVLMQGKIADYELEHGLLCIDIPDGKESTFIDIEFE